MSGCFQNGWCVAEKRVATGLTLRSARCVLRHPSFDDAQRLLSAFTHGDFPRLLPLRQITSLGQVRAWIERGQAAWREGAAYAWVVDRQGSGVLLGQVTLARRSGPGAWALAFWVHSDSWGQGYASEVAERVVAFAFDELEASAVWAGAGEWNRGSHGVPQKLGMTHIGDDPQGYRIDGEPVPTREYEISRESWRSRAGGRGG